LCGVPVYNQAFSHCAYLQRNGEAKLTWVAGHIPRWFACPKTNTHPSINPAWCRLHWSKPTR